MNILTVNSLPKIEKPFKGYKNICLSAHDTLWVQVQSKKFACF